MYNAHILPIAVGKGMLAGLRNYAEHLKELMYIMQDKVILLLNKKCHI